MTQPRMMHFKMTHFKMMHCKMTQPRMTHFKMMQPRMTHFKMTQPRMTQPRMTHFEMTAAAKNVAEKCKGKKLFVGTLQILEAIFWRHYTQHNVTQYNDNQHNNRTIQHSASHLASSVIMVCTTLLGVMFYCLLNVVILHGIVHIALFFIVSLSIEMLVVIVLSVLFLLFS
jgi:hypothetical protein